MKPSRPWAQKQRSGDVMVDATRIAPVGHQNPRLGCAGNVPGRGLAGGAVVTGTFRQGLVATPILAAKERR